MNNEHKFWPGTNRFIHDVECALLRAERRVILNPEAQQMADALIASGSEELLEDRE